MKLREQVVDNFNRDFVKLHTELDSLKKTSQLDRVEDLLLSNSHQVQHQTQEVQETIRTYEVMLEDFKLSVQKELS